MGVGPGGEDRGSRASEPAATSRGMVVVVGGVGGLDLCAMGLRLVLRAERLSYQFQVFRWGHGFGRWHADLTRVANRDLKARSLAILVRQFRSEHPGSAVFLVAKSGGCGVAVKALEQLDQEAVECAVLLAPALSPDYDLRAALSAVRRELVVFWSPLDLIILGVGTRLFGTMDRQRIASAGLVGFHIRPTRGTGSTDPYSKLRQVRWTPRMALTGYMGGHVGPDSPIFLRKYVLPLLRMRPDDGC